MEVSEQTEEQDQFEPYNAVSRTGPLGLGNNSAKVQRLNTNEAGDGTTLNGAVALKNMLTVNKGDTLKLSVQAYYENDPALDGTLSAAEVLSSILAGGEGGGLSGEGATLANSTLDESAVSAMNTNKTATAEDDVPRAYLNYMIFKEDMTYVTNGFIQISSGAKNLWETVEFPEPIIMEENGYFLTYVSNETNATSVVDFDNLTVEQVKTPVVQAENYYPFGLTYNSFVRSYSIPQNDKFNNGTEREDSFELRIDFTPFRVYDPSIGRWWQADLIHKFHESPYAWVTNNPIRFMDPLGLDTTKLGDFPNIVVNNPNDMPGSGSSEFGPQPPPAVDPIIPDSFMPEIEPSTGIILDSGNDNNGQDGNQDGSETDTVKEPLYFQNSFQMGGSAHLGTWFGGGFMSGPIFGEEVAVHNFTAGPHVGAQTSFNQFGGTNALLNFEYSHITSTKVLTNTYGSSPYQDYVKIQPITMQYQYLQIYYSLTTTKTSSINTIGVSFAFLPSGNGKTLQPMSASVGKQYSANGGRVSRNSWSKENRRLFWKRIFDSRGL